MEDELIRDQATSERSNSGSTFPGPASFCDRILAPAPIPAPAPTPPSFDKLFKQFIKAYLESN